MPGTAGGANVAHTYQTLIQSIQNLIKLNPDFMRNGIPNNLIQMCMEQTQLSPAFNVSVVGTKPTQLAYIQWD